MGFYKAQWAYRSALWPEPVAAGDILTLTEAQAAMLNADSPGVVEPVELVEKKDEPKARVVEEPPQTTAKRSPRTKRSSEDD